MTTSANASPSPLTSAIGVGSSGSMPANPKSKMGKDEFIKLLVAQLRNQDPLNPAEGQEMAAQLAQFSSVEQLMNINSAIASQAGANASLLVTMQANAAMGAIGKTVLAKGDQLRLGGEDGASSVTAYVGTAGTATLRVYDASGKEVGTQKLGYMNAGEREVALSDKIQGLAPGDYTYKLDVVDLKGLAVEVQPYMTGRVDAIQISPSGPVLVIRGKQIPFGDVVEVRR